ncbi:hypothetical protein M1O29_03835 [Dehalococcoidia bacterium]|nr:hypothetical protein [Dehalococcoidia bacterium]
MIFKRIWRAAKFDAALYQELQSDPIARFQAIVIVALSIFASALGGAIAAQFSGSISTTSSISTALALMPGIWLVGTISVYVLGGLSQGLRGTKVNDRQVFTAMGFAAAPSFLLLFVAIPVIWIVVLLWLPASMAFAAKNTMDISLLRAISFIGPGVMLGLLLISL